MSDIADIFFDIGAPPLESSRIFLEYVTFSILLGISTCKYLLWMSPSPPR
jgi:hypothetical protein